jgi:hypothetical protein
MSLPDDSLKKLAQDTAPITKAVDLQLSSPVAEAMRALDQTSATMALKGTQTLSVSRDFEEMQRKLQSISESSLMKLAREIESPLLAAVKAQKLWPPPHLAAAVMGTLPQPDFLKDLAKVQASLRSDLLKTFSVVKPLGDEFLERISTIESSAWHDFSARFLESSKGLTNIWQSSSIKLAQSLAESHWPLEASMAEALRELSAIGDLRGGAATLLGVGTITEASDTVHAYGSVTSGDTVMSDESSLGIWWKAQTFEVRVFLVILWILQTTVAALIGEGVKAWMNAGDHQERQIIYNQVTQDYGAEAARRLRCVRASALKVRSEASTTGQIIDSLPRGTAVEVLESQGSWSLIRYRVPHSSDIREGWAASGYLSLEIC